MALLSASSCATSKSADDATLQDLIATNLHADHLEHVTVVVSKRRATLTGSVASREELEAARKDAEVVDGVTSVRNEVEIVASGAPPPGVR